MTPAMRPAGRSASGPGGRLGQRPPGIPDAGTTGGSHDFTGERGGPRAARARARRAVSPEPAAPATGAAPEPLLPEQSREDTDAAWGEYPERADDRLYRDRPPHWDDF